jgi:hypothetical protein
LNKAPPDLMPTEARQPQIEVALTEAAPVERLLKQWKAKGEFNERL